jgi:hypothetical protein
MIRLFNKILGYTGSGVEIKVEPLTIFTAEGDQVGTDTITEESEVNINNA